MGMADSCVLGADADTMLRVVELFAGIGSPRMALTLAGIPHEVVAISEINRHAIDSYLSIYGETRNLGDISEVERLPECDLLTYGFPCQDLSLAGSRKGMGEGTRSGLVWEVMRLLEVSPRPRWLLMENVPQVVTSPLWGELIKRLESMGYRNQWAKIDSSHFGSPQKRVRVFMVSCLGAEPPALPTSSDAPHRVIRDILEPVIGEEYVTRIPMAQIKWREPKPTYRSHQSDGLVIPLMDCADPRLETRRIVAERSLSPTFCATGYIKVVSKEEEERAKKIVPKAQNLRMARGENITTMSKRKKPKTVQMRFDVETSSTPVAENVKESFYSSRMLYSSSSSSPTLRTWHGSKDAIKVVADADLNVIEMWRRLYDDDDDDDDDGLNPTVPKRLDNGVTSIKVVKSVDEDFLTVRKITPREAWRLMGFPDWAFDKAAEVSSKTQLYSQAGNSIVVEVLVAIFKSMGLDGVA